MAVERTALGHDRDITAGAGAKSSEQMFRGGNPGSQICDFRARRVFDPYAVARDFPDRWRDYVTQTFPSPEALAAAFAVTERTARHWWQGERGCQGRHVVVAVALHPEIAPGILFREAS